MSKLFVAFLWHMHQPVYKDPISKKYTLPWVRLHSTKSYNDMLSILEGFPDIRQTFNLVPSLMTQIQEYASGEVSDTFYELSQKPASELTPEERVFILQNFFAANWETMVLIYPRYRELLEKRGRRTSAGELGEIQKRFSDDDMRDLQVWSNLTWFGYAARDKDRELQQLFLRRRGFSESEKLLVLEKQRQLIQSLLPRYKAAQDSGQIEICVSPFYHPILPLLCDFESAFEAIPHVKLPREQFKHPEDARAQVASAISYYEHVFGNKPRGMWPSEGSVSPEAAAIVAEAGIQWIATDEEILLNTIKGKGRGEMIYAPYRLQLDGVGLNIVFRDKSLSDLIGFSYSKSQPEISAKDLFGHLRNIHSFLRPTSGENLVSIILDGENPWEYYPDGGRSFLTTLYSLFSQSDAIEVTTIGNYLERFPPKLGLKRIFSGSWISHNFNIWIGRQEDNTAWDMLARTRRHLERQQKNLADLAPEVLEAAWNEIYAAEGSDWFWWYGDDFSSAFDGEFDRLFRSHLMQVHRLLGEDIPAYLNEPIINRGATRPTEQPSGFLSPLIDGLVTHFYEWVAAGSFDVRKSGGAMNISETCISRMYWGFDQEHLFFRLDTSMSPLGPEMSDAKIAINFENEKRRRIELLLPSSSREKALMHIREQTGEETWSEPREGGTIGVKKIIEFSVSFSQLELKTGEEVKFHVTVHKGRIEIERWPRNGYIEFKVPGEDFEASMWFV
ncbi:MAG: glycoside hydrolase [Candidatus Abyssobacteria bacterium SURF_17]|uniref:Glycoside hydrolase n=1 Tax=Candidatus Abyssobacteria bacterium SURF_17 TaxID=2093361 RepID=A0A419ERK1_9BACT|nr:MAG: glycoside hydrolase [Candidatus Abyssubacteria bacterium SURF_17]